jgi:cystathionine beta-lyase/cystathionine gamma-synthase
MEFETRAIHAGQEPDPTTGSVITPIYQTSTYVQEAVGKTKGYDYSRVANPTRTALEVALASLENAAHGLAYSSGLGATTTIMHLVDPGQRVVLIADVYGGVYRMTSQVYEPKGYLFDYVPADQFPNLHLGGHSDVIGGAVVMNDEALADRLRFLQKSLGAVPGPFDAWLVLRGLKTLAVRMRQHCDNARRIAEYLDGHPAVERVLYPGLHGHPGHGLAQTQMRDFGGMVSLLLESEEEAVAFCGRTKLFLLAESLGGIESLIEHPARMTHASTANAPFAAPRNLVRLSVGIESADDLVADLEAALVRSGSPARA